MPVTGYRDVVFSDQLLTVEKMQQTSNNIRWLFENSPRIRYDRDPIIKDSSVKILAGKTIFRTSTADWVETQIYFKNFFSPGCRPVVTATVEPLGTHMRKLVTVKGFGGEIDHRGFVAHLSVQERVAKVVEASGLIDWIAVGY